MPLIFVRRLEAGYKYLERAVKGDAAPSYRDRGNITRLRQGEVAEQVGYGRVLQVQLLASPRTVRVAPPQLPRKRPAQ